MTLRITLSTEYPQTDMSLSNMFFKRPFSKRRYSVKPPKSFAWALYTILIPYSSDQWHRSASMRLER